MLQHKKTEAEDKKHPDPLLREARNVGYREDGNRWIRVLIADDDEQLLLILRESLKKYSSKFETVTVTDGLAAIQALQKQHFFPSGLRRPNARINGLVLLSYISKNFPKIPCIVMSAMERRSEKKTRPEIIVLHRKAVSNCIPGETIMAALGQQESSAEP